MISTGRAPELEQQEDAADECNAAGSSSISSLSVIPSEHHPGGIPYRRLCQCGATAWLGCGSCMAVKRPCFFDRAESGTHTKIFLCDCIGMLHSSESGQNYLLNSPTDCCLSLETISHADPPKPQGWSFWTL